MRAGWPWQGHPLPAGCLLPVDPEGPGDDGDHTVVFMVGKVFTVHCIQDNFVFGQNSKSLLVFRNGPVRSFGTFYATVEKQNGDIFIHAQKIGN